jgi:RNA polymerase sigma-70 factor (ECF subfamily)
VPQDPFEDAPQALRRVYAFVAFRIGSGHDAEDITSETLTRALKHRDQYDPSRGSPVVWMIGIARRVMADRARADHVPATAGTEWPGRAPMRRLELMAEPPEVADPAEVAEQAATRMTVRDAVGSLPDRDRELISLRYGADLSADQIAELLDMRRNAVEVALHRAMTRLREVVTAESRANSA